MIISLKKSAKTFIKLQSLRLTWLIMADKNSIWPTIGGEFRTAFLLQINQHLSLNIATPIDIFFNWKNNFSSILFRNLKWSILLANTYFATLPDPPTLKNLQTPPDRVRMWIPLSNHYRSYKQISTVSLMFIKDSFWKPINRTQVAIENSCWFRFIQSWSSYHQMNAGKI